MNIFKKQKNPPAASVQTARQAKSFPLFSGRNMDRHTLSLYSSLRENVPIIDAAISKIVRLIGHFTVSCGDSAADAAIEKFLQEVPAGPAANGIDSFLSALTNSLLCYGTGVGEMVIGSDGRLAALYPAALSDVNLSLGENPLTPQISTCDGKAVSHPERILLCALSPDGEHPFGVSLLSSLPFVCSVLLKIYECIGVNFERMGNLRFAVTYRPGDNSVGDAKAEEIAAAWSEAMRDQSAVRDFVAVGDVDIKVIGGEAAMPEVSIPIRTIEEQIVAKTGMPPFLLGLSWSSTERMSTMQLDIFTSELDYYRAVLTPVILKICRTFLRGEGFFCEPQVIWDNISLQDELTLSEARLNRARAMQIESTNGGE